MTIQDWGSIGELIAAIATVATLFYLAMQIRANTVALKLESRRHDVIAANAYITSVIEHPDVARLFTDGMRAPESLSREDFMRFAFLMGQFVGAEAVHYDEVQTGIAPRESLHTRRVGLLTFLDTPGGRLFWQRFAAQYPEGFRAYVDREVLPAERNASTASATTSH